MTGARRFGSVLTDLMHLIRPQFLGRLLALLAVALPLRSQTLEYFSPPRDARALPARPTLAWSFGTGNLLTNPGFEDGTNGWTVSGGTVVNLVFPSGAAEGSKAIRVNRGTVSREITLPPGPEQLTLSFALREVTPLSDSQRLQYARVEVVDLEGMVPSQSFPVMGISAVVDNPWYPVTIDLGPFRGRPVRLTWSMPAADLRRQNWFLDAVKLTPVPAGTEF